MTATTRDEIKLLQDAKANTQCREIFLKALKLIERPSRWTQRQSRRLGLFGYRYCSVGAIAHVSVCMLYRDVIRALDRSTPDGDIVAYNDTHSHAEVIAVWRATGRRMGWID